MTELFCSRGILQAPTDSTGQRSSLISMCFISLLSTGTVMKPGEGGCAWMMDISNEAWSLRVKHSTLSTHNTLPVHNLMHYHTAYNAATLPYTCLWAYFKSKTEFTVEIQKSYHKGVTFEAFKSMFKVTSPPYNVKSKSENLPERILRLSWLWRLIK